jgi:16S rRNA processing protein RimM
VSLFFSRVFFRIKGDLKEFKVEYIRPFGEFCVVKLEGIDTLDGGQEIAGQEIWIPEEDCQPLDSGNFYLFQLSGCSVVTKSGELIGSVKDILFIQENDLLVVEKEGREKFIPFSESICIAVNLEKKEIVIDPPDGLLDLNEI